MTKTTQQIPDAAARERALDPSQSFIVQAPAGSGKTELLTQRFLVLLSHAEKVPEEIVAITFTKKAAAEMRSRIIMALHNAAQTDTLPEQAHAQQTWKLAKRVLQRNHELQWQLLDNPNRLQVLTIDALCAKLTRRMPLLSQFGAQPDITDDQHHLYEQAADEILSHLEEDLPWSDAIAKLLLHIDNDTFKAKKLLINMLYCREQWLPHLVGNDTEAFHTELNQALIRIADDALQSLATQLEKIDPDQSLRQELLALLYFAAEQMNHLQMDNQLADLLHLQQLPNCHISAYEQWLTIAKYLLKKDYDWRKTVTKNQGFPAASSATTEAEREQLKSMKQRMLAMLATLGETEGLRYALENLLKTPGLIYSPEQWDMICQLSHLLPILVAQLTVIFQTHGKVDFTEIASRALHALGTDDAPTDLALFFDYQIRHLLIDEFQDTSISQYQLIKRLTTGWHKGDNRSLFLVGDPMQSIYRFRQAEVGLFMRARTEGIGHIALQPLKLQVNFRSNADIVNWNNDFFSFAFPAVENIAQGAVSYHASVPFSQVSADNNIQLLPLINSDDENAESLQIIQIIQHIKQAHPEHSIAILVRARTHLYDVLPCLHQANIKFQAIEIERLADRTVVQDLLALTRALLHPADRIAWLAILRSPWCGLTLEDLYGLAGTDTGRELTVWEQLNQTDTDLGLSADGLIRVQHIRQIFQRHLQQRGRLPMRTWVENIWQDLGSHYYLDDPHAEHDAEAYFNLLERLETAGGITDLEYLEKQLLHLYAEPNPHADPSIQVMTIHKAKGLEFDHVIIPGLERRAAADKSPLLAWMERPLANGQSDLLLAPIKASGQTEDPIFNYIRDQDKSKSYYEMLRLLYVATTRAKQQLYLFASLYQQADGEFTAPHKTSFLYHLWPLFLQNLTTQEQQAAVCTDIITETEDALLETAPANLQRFSSAWFQQFGRKRPQLFPDMISPARETRADGDPRGACALPLGNPSALTPPQAGESSFFEEQEAITTASFRPPSQHWCIDYQQEQAKHTGTLVHRLLQQITEQGYQHWQTKDLNHYQQAWHHALLHLGVLPEQVPAALMATQNAIVNILVDPKGCWILDNSHTESACEQGFTLQQAHDSQHFIIDRTFIDDTGKRWIIDYKTSQPQDQTENIEQFLHQQKQKYAAQLQQYGDILWQLEQRPIGLALYFPLIQQWIEWEYSQ